MATDGSQPPLSDYFHGEAPYVAGDEVQDEQDNLFIQYVRSRWCYMGNQSPSSNELVYRNDDVGSSQWNPYKKRRNDDGGNRHHQQ